MSAGSAALLQHSALDEDSWEDLLSFIEERRVIPILGPELLQVETDQGPRLLYDWLAEKLAAIPEFDLYVTTTFDPLLQAANRREGRH